MPGNYLHVLRVVAQTHDGSLPGLSPYVLRWSAPASHRASAASFLRQGHSHPFSSPYSGLKWKRTRPLARILCGTPQGRQAEPAVPNAVPISPQVPLRSRLRTPPSSTEAGKPHGPRVATPSLPPRGPAIPVTETARLTRHSRRPPSAWPRHTPADAPCRVSTSRSPQNRSFPCLAAVGDDARQEASERRGPRSGPPAESARADSAQASIPCCGPREARPPGAPHSRQEAHRPETVPNRSSAPRTLPGSPRTIARPTRRRGAPRRGAGSAVTSEPAPPRSSRTPGTTEVQQ